jgi:hypothetical protein
MGNLRWLLLAGLSALVTVLAIAQHPTLDHAAANVVAEYQSNTCEQLWRHRVKQASQEQRVIGSLRSDPAMREEFINKIAGPVASKMLDCGMIP